MLKTVFSSIVFLFVWTGGLLAQNVPFPQSDALWKETHTTIAGPIFAYTALCGDTILNGTHYSQVLALQVDSVLDVVGSTFLGGLRSNNGVVRYLPSGSTSELLLYDFHLQAGATITFPEIPVIRTVDSVKVELLSGKLRKVIYFAPGSQFAPVEFWVEGVGSNFGLLGRGHDPGADIGASLECFRHKDDFFLLTPNDCFLPLLPDNCGIANAAPEVTNNIPIKLTAQPNPSGPDVRFTINQAQLPEACNLKVYAANGKLLGSVPNAQPQMNLPDGLSLRPGFYIATLETAGTERVVAHCTFVVGQP